MVCEAKKSWNPQEIPQSYNRKTEKSRSEKNSMLAFRIQFGLGGCKVGPKTSYKMLSVG